jgi:CAAX amino terminal protease family.
MRKAIKLLLSIIALMVLIQLLRMLIEQIVFIFTPRTYFTDDVATMLAMILLTAAFLLFSKARGVSLSFFPNRVSLPYIIGTILYLGLMISSAVMQGADYKSIINIIYASVVTPLFEEIIFRGYIWNRLNTVFKREIFTYAAVTLLFAVWHLGYIDGLAFRVQVGLANVMLWKAVTGLCFGLVLGALRLKTRNSYSTMLLHGVMNIFGR